MPGSMKERDTIRQGWGGVEPERDREVGEGERQEKDREVGEWTDLWRGVSAGSAS